MVNNQAKPNNAWRDSFLWWGVVLIYQQMARNEFERAIEKITGKTVEEIRDTPVEVLRAQAEKKHGQPTQIKSVSKVDPIVNTVNGCQ